MKMNMGGIEELVVTRDEFPLERAKKALEADTVSNIGYGSQGPGQSQNLRDQGFKVIVGQRMGTKNWEKAKADGWIPGETLFTPEDAAARGTIISLLVSDASSGKVWKDIEPFMSEGKMLYVSHGFPTHFSELTGIKPKSYIDVGMIAPKGAGLSVRRNFLNKSGINSSFAVMNDYSKRTLERTLAMGIGIGSGYLFETTDEREVVSDHVGERAILLGGTWALAEVAYDLLKKQGMPSLSAFKASSEQITQVILPLIGATGAAGVYEQAIKNKQLGTVLKYRNHVRSGLTETLESLYESCRSGDEARIALVSNSREDYRTGLEAELAAIEGKEIWHTGKVMRDFAEKRNRPRDYEGKITNFALAGAVLGFMEAQYSLLIRHGHWPSEAFNETVEELTQSLNQFYQAKGVAGKGGLLEVCSTTAQRGALDWGIKRFYTPLLEGMIRASTDTGYMAPVEGVPGNYTPTLPNMWDVGATVRTLRPEFQKMN